MHSLFGQFGQTGRVNIKAEQIFKSLFMFCIFCLRVSANWAYRQTAVWRGEAGNTSNSCEKPSDLSFLTLQRPTRE